MESRLDVVDKMLQELIQDKDRQENQFHERFQRLEDMIKGLTAVVESLSCSATKGKTASVMNVGQGSRWEEETSHHLSSSKWRKLDIPNFAGEEAYGWTNRLERYFQLKEVNEEERMHAVIVALEGKALNWFHWWETCNPNPTWEAFKGITQDYLVGIFLNGLKEEIKAEVKLYEPNTRPELMMKAQMVEEKWLASLGEVRDDFSNLRLTIGKGNDEHILVGDPTLSKSESSLKKLVSAFNNNDSCYVLKWDKEKEENGSIVPVQLLPILESNNDLFQDLVRLPPSRPYDHAIHLHEGAFIPNLRPYKYSHQQKNEIERLVKEMLQAGIIKPSISPYSSPIILVKEKDGG
ncbi:uncharacterized protein LOC106778660 [Vigna radiata var. radiata]|uniref:Uncharacterized protein LOC106778660 n=1 Tax=Vigna radiata var. radiata TaxID=3916 RepID=A0A1S3VUZ3_VIGRR|nr:uncharacterized protein LOC106778660 [Vigna radiata var. radiata]